MTEEKEKDNSPILTELIMEHVSSLSLFEQANLLAWIERPPKKVYSPEEKIVRYEELKRLRKVERDKRNASVQQELIDTYDTIRENDPIVTIAKLADHLGVSDASIRTRLKKNRDFINEKGVVAKRVPSC